MSELDAQGVDAAMRLDGAGEDGRRRSPEHQQRITHFAVSGFSKEKKPKKGNL